MSNLSSYIANLRSKMSLNHFPSPTYEDEETAHLTDSKSMEPNQHSSPSPSADNLYSSSLGQNSYHSSQLSRFSKGKYPWILASLLLLCTTIYLSIKIRKLESQGSFEGGFATDFDGVKMALNIQKVTFTGTPSFTSDGVEYIKPQQGRKEYVGTPNKQMDENWNDLTKYRYFLLNEAEAKGAWGSDFAQFWNEERQGYTAGFDMFHTLHCLDHIRQAFYPTYYPQTPIHGEMHRDHCIDHIRQIVMCYADITPIPTRYFEGIHQNYIDSDREHTCRDFSAIRKWTSERFVSDGLMDFIDHRN